jgi:Tfp pilus assembly protein FimT
MTHRKKIGFSLLELSCVFIIISILIMAVAKGNQILGRSRIVGAQSLTKASPILRTSNLIAWYETTMDNSFSQSDVGSTNIDTWYNLNPATRTNNAIAGNAPIYKPNSINNLPTLLFNGTSNYLSFDGSGIANDNYTVIIVEQRLDNGSNRYFISGNPSATTNRNLTLGYKTNTSITFSQTNNDYVITVPGYYAPVPAIHIFRFSSTIGKNYYLNGNLQTLTGCCGTPVATKGLEDYSGAQIGRFATTNYYYGNIGEIVIFNKYVNDEEMNEIKLYLSKKWMINVN